MGSGGFNNLIQVWYKYFLGVVESTLFHNNPVICFARLSNQFHTVVCLGSYVHNTRDCYINIEVCHDAIRQKGRCVSSLISVSTILCKDLVTQMFLFRMIVYMYYSMYIIKSMKCITDRSYPSIGTGCQRCVVLLQ